MIAPIVAARDPQVAFVVLLAGPGIPIVELLHNKPTTSSPLT
jgi:hypothetical protein